MLGGVFWALGNVTAIPIMNVLGLGMGMLIWGVTNCVTGWAVGRAVAVSLIAGVFYGITFVPVIYIQDHPDQFPGASKDGLAYVFSHYCGIFVTATALLVLYIIFSGNNPIVNNKIIGPSLITGCMWAVAQTSWFIANDNLSQSVTFPIISMVPGVCGAMWSVFYFKEITGHRNLRVLTVAILTTLAGAVLVGISK
ncbi:unnamed protein product [Heligmosomoides polygyrus]|uniref:Transmembrane protein 144 n=1 Tax=Heligmosomoides polygyrus TaxID=6339 RepID=A0A183FPP7_HELPZ|nr:unnamed protein product [Heligmosomoides polygyrus]